MRPCRDQRRGRGNLDGQELRRLLNFSIFFRSLPAASHRDQHQHRGDLLPHGWQTHKAWLEPQLDSSDTRSEDSSLQQFTALALSNAFILLFCLTDGIFYQSAALPPLAAPAQTWKHLTANTRLLAANAAAAASAQIQLGSALLVSQTRPLEPDSGRWHQFALQTGVAARVSNLETIVENVPSVDFNLKDCLPQVSSPLQTTPKIILTTLRGQIGFK